MELKPSTYRAGNFKHPQKTINHKRWELIFTLIDEDEEKYNVSFYGTSYGEGDPLEDMKGTMLKALHTVLSFHFNPKFICLSHISRERQELDLEEVAHFISLFDPSFKSVSLENIPIIEDYQYILYSTLKGINSIREDEGVFATDRELMDWLFA